MKTHQNIGSSFDDFLGEQGELEEITAIAVKRVIAWQDRSSDEGNRNHEIRTSSSNANQVYMAEMLASHLKQ